MTKLNHSRPILQLIDNFNRENRRPLPELRAAFQSKSPKPKEAIYSWQAIVAPPMPDEDANLSASEKDALNALLHLHHRFVIAYGSASPLLGKASRKRKDALAAAEQDLIAGSSFFLRFCGKMASTGSLRAWHWLQDHCNANLRNGNGIYEWLVSAVLEFGLEDYFWSSLKGSDTDRAELTAFVQEVASAT